MLPTPTAAQYGMIPTPTAGDAKSSGSRNLPGSSAHAGVSLTDFVKHGNSSTPRSSRPEWPTPAARDYKHPNKTDKEGGDHRGDTKSGKQLPNAVGGALNPNFVEWLMGWPRDWTKVR